jgi:hypothetical protein
MSLSNIDYQKMKKSLPYILSLMIALLNVSASAASQQDPVRADLIKQIIILSERGDPATMEKQQAGYLIDAIKSMNPSVPVDTWNTVRSEVNETISNKVRSGYGESGLLVQKFLSDENFSDDDLRHLLAVLQDPILTKYANAMRDETQGEYMRNLSKATYNQMWFIVSIIARKHGLQTSNSPTQKSQQTEAH